MIPYIVITIIIIGCSFLDLTNFCAKRIVFFCAVLLLVLFAGLRFEIGTDWSVYYNRFKGTDSSMLEPGFELLMSFSKLLSQQFTLTVMLFGIIGVGIKYKAISSLSPMPFIGLLFYYGYYYYPQEFNQMRQGLATTFCLFAVPSIYKKQNIKFIIFVLIACMFHASAIVFILAYWIHKVLPSKQYVLLILTLVSMIFMFINIGELLIDFILKVALKIIPIPIADERMTSYVKGRYAVPHGFYLGSLFLVYFAALFIYYLNKIDLKEYKIITKIFIFGVIMNFVFNSMSILERLSFFYLILGAISYSYVVNYESNFYMKLLLYLVLVLISFFKVFVYITKTPIDYLPYETFLNV